jgi:TRAP-type mannitol/chloroaromatic compound transport system substrate-binding protein
MKPRTIVFTWIAFALPVLILAAVLWHGPRSAGAQPRIVWKVQSAWPATNLLHVSAVELAKMVEEMSGGRLKWEMSAAGTVVGAFEVLDAVNRGIIDAAHAWPGYWAGKNSAAGLFGPGPTGPFGMDREEYLGWLFAGGGLELYNELLKVYEAEAQKNPFFAKVLKSQKDFAARAVPHAQKIRPPIEVVVAHYWKK